MSHLRIGLLAALLSAVPAAGSFATAEEAAWHYEDGASLRIVAATPQADGTLRAALQVRLKPGWKTYWLDPGESGVPPTVVVDDPAVASALLHFPAPRRFDDGYTQWAGYGRPVALPISLELAATPASGRLAADVFIGVCETICIPVQTRLEFDVGADASLPAREAIVGEAFSTLPEPASETTRLKLVEATPDELLVEARVPEGIVVEDVFVASTSEVTLAMAEPVDGRPGVFALRIVDGAPGATTPFYTLVTSEGAFAGTLAVK